MNSAEQNPATNPLLETPPNAPANNADAADPSISAFPRKHFLQTLDISCRFRCSGRCRIIPLALSFRASNPLTMLRWTLIFILSALASPDMFRKSTLKTTNGWMKARPSWKSIRKTMKLHWHERRLRWRLQRPSAKSSNIDVPISSVVTSSQLKSAASDIKNAEAAIQAAEKQAAAARARILEAQAENVKAQDDVTRYRLLLAKEEVPKQTYDHAYAAAATDVAAVAAAEADEAAAQQAIQEAHSRLTEAEAHYEDAQAGPQRVTSTRDKAYSAMADVKQKSAAVEQAQLNLGYTRILAPAAGEVTKKVVVGLNVDPGEQLLTVVPLDQVWITANFKETQLKRMRVGQKAEIELDSNGRTYHGHVDSIAGATGPIFSLLPPENATGNYVKIVQRVPVKIVLDPGENRDRQLRPGMNVEAKVYLR